MGRPASKPQGRHTVHADKKYLPIVGQRMRSVRMSLGLSLKQAAEKTGVNEVRISSYERGDRQPGIDQLAQVAAGYGVTVATFLPDVAAEPTPLAPERIIAALNDIHERLGDVDSALEAIRKHLAFEQQF